MDCPSLQVHDLVGRRDQHGVVRRHEHTGAGPRRCHEHVRQSLRGRLVELRRRLVEHDELGADAEGPRHRHPLALAAGQQPHRPVPQRQQIEGVEPGAGPPRVGRQSAHRAGDLEVAHQVGCLREVHGLAHDGRVLPAGPCQARPVERAEIHAAQLDPAGVRAFETDEHPQ